jgi:environmental stress-induced protein Ves
MRHKKIAPNQWSPAPWKNGGGSTVQLGIFPPTSSLAEANYIWRVSLATATQSGPFSEFPGYDRVLAVLGDRPMVLRHESDGTSEGTPNGAVEQILRPLEPYSVSGHLKTDCKILGDEVRDLNVMIKHDRGSVEMHVLELPPNARRKVGVTDCSVFFCVKGKGRFVIPVEGRRPVIHDDFGENTTFIFEPNRELKLSGEKLDIEVGPEGATFLVTDFLLHLG